MTTGMPQGVYTLEAAWGKQVGVADVAPLWNSAPPWTGGANAAYASYVDLTSKIGNDRAAGIDFTQPITITRGKQQMLGPVNAGSFSCTILDPDRVLDVLNASSPIASKLLPYVGIRFGGRTAPAGTWYPRFMGWITSYHRERDRPGTVTINAQDLLHRMGRVINIGVITGQSISHTSDALTWALSKLPWTYTDFQTGIAIDSSTGLQNNFSSTDSILSFIQGVVDPSLGTFYIGVDGTAIFVNRGGAHRGVQATITNTMTAVPSESDIDLIYNKATATMTRPAVSGFTPQPQTTTDSTSINQYGPSVWQLTSPWWASNTDAASAASFVVSKYKSPVNRIRQVTVRARDSATLTALLTVDVGDQVTVTEARDGTTGTYVVWGIQEQIDQTGHQAVWTLAPLGV